MPADIVIVDPATVDQWLKDGQALVVDVREDHERAVQSIAGTVGLPLSRFDLSKLPPLDGRHLVFHCQAGIRCQSASEMAYLSGFRGRIHRLAGGLNGWAQAGLPVQSGQGG